MSSHTNEMTMVERVARAICKGRGRNPDVCVQEHGWVGPNGSGSVCSLGAWQVFVSDARAAIEAMKTPTGRMEAASARIAHATDRQIYQAMIEEALRCE